MNQRKIPVSVIIPTYNRSHLLRRALLSILKQTVLCQEIIVVDDGSTDESLEMLAAFKEEFQEVEIRLYRQKNRGPAAARNHGIQHARGEFFAFLDSDDHWLPKKLERQYNLLEENAEYVVSHTLERWLRRGQHLNQKRRHIPRNGDIFNQCLELCAVGMSTVMLRKEVFNGVGLFNESMPCCEDYDIWLRISCRYPFLLVDEALTIKEGGRDDQVSYQYRTGMDKFRIESLLRLMKLTTLSPSQRLETIQELIRKCRVYGNGCLKHNKSEEGQYYIQLAGDFAASASLVEENTR